MNKYFLAFFIKTTLMFNYAHCKTDIVLFSYDRPLQIYATLESIQKYANGLDAIHIIYRTSSTQYKQSYSEAFNDFPNLNLHLYWQDLNPQKDFKLYTLDILNQMTQKGNIFVIFSTDDAILTDYINIEEMEYYMEKTSAFSFLIRLGKNITYSYMQNIQLTVPNLIHEGNDVYSWIFKNNKSYWEYPASLDMGMFWIDNCLQQFQIFSFNNPNQLEGTWASKEDRNCIGLCYKKSKMFTLPLNIVSENGGKNMNLHSKEQLLEFFQNNLKIDISIFHAIINKSAHEQYKPKFIKRK